MSSSSDPANQTEQPSEESSPEAESVSEAVVEAAECPNCGRRFVGDYCPNCGQEANPSLSVTSVIGGFFRDLVDLDNGFLPTFVALALRPGEILQEYLRGIRKGITSPGRYLLAAIVLEVGVDRVMAWSGAKPNVFGAESDGGSGPEKGIDVALSHAREPIWPILEGPQARIIAYLLLTGLLALLFHRLFEDQLRETSEAFAVATFVVAQVALFTTVISLVYDLPVSLYTGNPTSSSILSVAVIFGYGGYASYWSFGHNWKAALKGAFAMLWGVVEVLLIAVVSVLLYAAYLIHNI